VLLAAKGRHPTRQGANAALAAIVGLLEDYAPGFAILLGEASQAR